MTIQIEHKIKAYSIFRPEDHNNIAKSDGFTNDMDRRLVLSKVPRPLASSLRWQKRPRLAGGNPSWTYMVDSPNGRFGVLVGMCQTVPTPRANRLECWVLGEAPRGLNAVCKSLSMDMRSRDRGWLRMKLDSLSNCPGEAFDMVMPNETLVRVKSDVAAFAQLVRYRCAELGAFDDEKLTDTPLVDALMSKKEPKAGPDGTLAPNFSIRNCATGDDFEMFLKEAVLDNGQRRPFSVWFSGEYAPSLDGLAKCLSIDLRVSDIDWGARKLRQLLDVTEPRGDFLAQVPGSDKSTLYGSTVAYIASLILRRLNVVGLVNDRGEATHDSAVIDLGAEREARQEPSTHEGRPKGLLCEGCGSYTARISEGCKVCTCGFSKCG